MATSPNPRPVAPLASEGQAAAQRQIAHQQESLRRSEQRLAQVRERHARQRRRFRWTVVLVVLAGLSLGIGLIAGQPRPEPQLVVLWPKPKAHQPVAPGSAILLRPGLTLGVTVADAGQWNLSWLTPTVSSKGAETSWTSAGEPSTLTVQARPTPDGWQGLVADLVARLRAPMSVTLRGVVAEPLRGFRHQITPPPEGVWVAPYILAGPPGTPAGQSAAWDERAVTTLAEVNLERVKPGDPAPQWALAAAFGDTANAREDATYFRLLAPQPDVKLPVVARQLAKSEPQLSIKFVVRLDDPPTGILRLAYDGKRERAAWIKRSGATEGTPFEWEAGNDETALPPAAPTAMPTATETSTATATPRPKARSKPTE